MECMTNWLLDVVLAGVGLRLIGLAHMVDSAMDEIWMKCLNYPCNQFYSNHCCVNCECDDADGCLFGRMEHIARDNYLFEELVPIILEIQIQNFKWIFHFFDICMYVLNLPVLHVKNWWMELFDLLFSKALIHAVQYVRRVWTVLILISYQKLLLIFQSCFK